MDKTLHKIKSKGPAVKCFMETLNLIYNMVGYLGHDVLWWYTGISMENSWRCVLLCSTLWFY